MRLSSEGQVSGPGAFGKSACYKGLDANQLHEPPTGARWRKTDETSAPRRNDVMIY